MLAPAVLLTFSKFRQGLKIWAYSFFICARLSNKMGRIPYGKNRASKVFSGNRAPPLSEETVDLGAENVVQNKIQIKVVFQVGNKRFNIFLLVKCLAALLMLLSY